MTTPTTAEWFRPTKVKVLLVGLVVMVVALGILVVWWDAGDTPPAGQTAPALAPARQEPPPAWEEPVRFELGNRAPGAGWADELAVAKGKIATLERDLDAVVATLNALVEKQQREEAAAKRASQPSWSAARATGEPDTMTAGDFSTAWAPGSMDGGAEWLQLGYEKAVELAQVRVRETCGPGCIEKVAAVLENGTEVVIWQGRQTPAEGIAEPAFNAPAGLLARGVKVYLDTKRVPGWNEIDAVEMVGRDGTRQWAQTATASSSFGAGNGGNLDYFSGTIPFLREDKKAAGSTGFSTGLIPRGSRQPQP
ncbi:MAG: hypothetical protein K8R23_10140 [Chthoniobacter sp.]|nr:hypothetical protein [Chthoniobacter sp.]